MPLHFGGSNVHDNPVEPAITSVFVIGPIAAVICAIIGFKLSKRAVGRPTAKQFGNLMFWSLDCPGFPGWRLALVDLSVRPVTK